MARFIPAPATIPNELTVPVRALMKEGYEITFANPKGNTPQLDVHSAVADFFGGDEAKLQDYLKFRDTLTGGLKIQPVSRMSCRAWINMTLFSPRRPWPDAGRINIPTLAP